MEMRGVDIIENVIRNAESKPSATIIEIEIICGIIWKMEVSNDIFS